MLDLASPLRYKRTVMQGDTMVMTGNLSRRLYEHLAGRGTTEQVQDVRIGLGYVGVRLRDGGMGLAALLRSGLQEGCTLLDEAGSLAGKRAADLLHCLVAGNSPLERSIGLATANALLSADAPGTTGDAIELMDLTPADRVTMVGLFRPLIEPIRQRGATLSIIEKNPRRAAVPDGETSERLLRDCTVAIITATAILNDSIEAVLSGLGSPRHTAVIGPSTPLCRDVFAGTPVTHLGGSVVMDSDKIMQIISEGGGTPVMRPYLRFVNMVW